ncbi:uncharacterized protein LOC129771338 [Toxorhynchites rutilus septentrionalis]|nr:uncharacterized protein LOC129771338 [Toxorhynchites rutilus septentrionalis]
MEIDSGSAVSVISEANCRRYFKGIPMCSSSRQLVVVDGARLKILGEIYVQVELNGRVAQQKLVVLKCSNIFVPLIGRSWLDCFFPGWRSCFTNTALVNSLNEKTGIDDIVECMKQKYRKIFDKDFSEPIVGYEGELVLKHEQPIFKKAYTVPYKLKDKLAQHLEMLEQQKDDDHGTPKSIKTGSFSGPKLVSATSGSQSEETPSDRVRRFSRLYGIRGRRGAFPGFPRGDE